MDSSRGASRGTTGEDKDRDRDKDRDKDREGFRGLFAGSSRGNIEDSGLGLLGSRDDRDRDRGRHREKEKEKEDVIASSIEGLDSRISDLKSLFRTVDPVERKNCAATRYCSMRYGAVKYSTIHCVIVAQYSMVQCNVVLFLTPVLLTHGRLRYSEHYCGHYCDHYCGHYSELCCEHYCGNHCAAYSTVWTVQYALIMDSVSP